MRNLKNSVQLIGALGKSPEFRINSKGQRTALITLITKDYPTNGNETNTRTTNWHSLVVFGSDAEITLKHLKKGSVVLVEGKLFNRQHQSPQGQWRNTTEIHVNELQMLKPRSEQILRAA